MLRPRLGAAAFAIALVVAPLVAAQNAARAASFAGSVQSNDTTTLTVAADLTGDLMGYFTFSVTRDSGQPTGSWVWMHKRTNADGSVDDLGMIEGTLMSGRLTTTDGGSVASLDDVRLTVTAGTGEFENLGGGSGTLNGSIAGTQFTGALSLTF